jgi:hypothetical protein
MLLLFGIFSLLWWLGQRTWCGNYVSSLLRKQLLLEQFVESGDGEFDINNTAFFGGTTTTVTTNNITVYDDWSDISMASAMAASLFAGYLGVDFFLLAQGNRWYHLAGLIKLFLTLYSTQGVYRHVRGQKRDEELFWRYSYGMNFSLLWWVVDAVRIGTCAFPDGGNMCMEPPVTIEAQVGLFLRGPFLLFVVYAIKIALDSNLLELRWHPGEKKRGEIDSYKDNEGEMNRKSMAGRPRRATERSTSPRNSRRSMSPRARRSQHTTIV